MSVGLIRQRLLADLFRRAPDTKNPRYRRPHFTAEIIQRWRALDCELTVIGKDGHRIDELLDQNAGVCPQTVFVSAKKAPRLSTRHLTPSGTLHVTFP